MRNKLLFSEYMSLFAELYDKEITPVLSRAYWTVLKPYADEQIEAAFKRAVNECRFFPKPADLVGFISADTGKDDQPKLAWAKVDQSVRKHGPWSNVQFDDPVIHSVIEAMGGWSKLCSCTNDEWVWRQKDFEELYPLMAKKPEHPRLLGGSIAGEPIMIGDLGRESLKLIAGGRA